MMVCSWDKLPFHFVKGVPIGKAVVVQKFLLKINILYSQLRCFQIRLGGVFLAFWHLVLLG